MSDAILNAMVGVGVTRRTALEVGHRIRDARIISGKSTSEIATRIKVREHYLSAIEEGEWDVLPPGVNGRGLVRLYARDLDVAVPEIEPRFVPESSAREATQQEIRSVKSDSAESADKKPGAKPRTVASPQVTTTSRATTTRTATSRYEPRTTRRDPYAKTKITDEDDTQAIDASDGQLAALLGITEPEKPAAEPMRPIDQPILFDNNVPIVKADQLAKEMFGEAPTATQKMATKKVEAEPAVLPAPEPAPAPEPVVEPAKEPIQEVAKPVAEPLVETIAKPVAEPTMEAISEPLSAPITEQTAQPEPESVAASVEQPDEPPLTEPVVEPQPSAVNTRYQSNVDEGLVNPDSEITTRLSAAEESTKAQASSEKTLQKVFLVAISVAAVLALVVGISSFRKSQVEKEEALSMTESIVTPEPTVVTEQTVAVEPAASTGATNTDPNSTQPPVQGGVTGPQDTAAAGAVASPAVIATVAGTLPTPLPTVVPTANPTATPPPEPTPALGAAHKATLVVTESVAIKISLDGKISFSGTREAGSYPIEFQKSADIYVEDGSKVSLKYPGWDNHGPLGMVARKRRVILSSDPYPGFGRGSL